MRNGPFEYSGAGPLLYKKWYTQPKPYVAPLPFQLSYAQREAGDLSNVSFFLPYTDSSANMQLAENKAAKDLLASLSNRANLAVALAEGRQTITMIATKVTALISAVKQIKSGKFRKAAVTLGIKQPRGASRSKQFANNWLEYSFGWKPFISDIYALGDILQSPISSNLKASGKGSHQTVIRNGRFPANIDGVYTARTINARCKSGCRISWIKPDLWLMNQLGLVNPAVVLWEKVPYSFVVDWFTDFGSYLESLTGLVGVEIADPWTTYSCEHGLFIQHRTMSTEVEGLIISTVNAGSSFSLERKLQLATVQPVPRFSRFSTARGANAVSLLIQQLKRV